MDMWLQLNLLSCRFHVSYISDHKGSFFKMLITILNWSKIFSSAVDDSGPFIKERHVKIPPDLFGEGIPYILFCSFWNILYRNSDHVNFHCLSPWWFLRNMIGEQVYIFMEKVTFCIKTGYDYTELNTLICPSFGLPLLFIISSDICSSSCLKYVKTTGVAVLYGILVLNSLEIMVLETFASSQHRSLEKIFMRID